MSQNSDKVFSHTEVEEFSQCCLTSIVLCQWNDIIGPQTRHVWSSSGKILLLNSLKPLI